MPSINNIDKFAQTLNSLGDEPRILKERGETLEKVKVPPKDEERENPFNVNIEDEGIEEELPDLAADLDMFEEEDDLLGIDDDFDGAPDLEEDESFTLDDLDLSMDGTLEDTTDIIDVESLEEPEEIPQDLDAFEEVEEISAEEGELLEDLDFDNIEIEEDTTDIIDIESLEEPTDILEDLDAFEEIEEIPVEESDLLDDLDLDNIVPEAESLDDLENIESEELLEDLNLDDITPEDTLEDLDSGELLSDLDLDTVEPDIEGDGEFGELLEDLDLEEEIQEEETSDFGELLEDLDLDTSLEDAQEVESEPDELLDELDLSLDESEDTDTAGFDDLEELTDLDLDTTESLEEDLSIQDIALDDIKADEPEELSLDELDDSSLGLSIEDEVLEDDFGSLDDEESDEFSLVDFGDTFNLDEEDSSSLLKLDEFTETVAEEEEPQEEVKYTQEEFNSIKKTLMGLPLNVRIIIEEEIAENGLFGVKLEGLVSLLISEASLKEIVKYLNKTLGHKVKVSSSFEKISALELEARKTKFSYIFVNTVIPKVKWVMPITIAASLLFLAGYFFGYKIIKSENIYEEGHELILIDKYEEARDEFMKAFNTHRKMKWYYIYADTYVQRKAYNYAEEIYLQILNEDSSQIRAVLSYAKMKGLLQGEYEKAANFLLNQTTRGVKDYHVYSTLGDIYMEWGEIDSSRYEDARLWYNETRDAYGNKPPILFKLLNYFIVTDKFDEVMFQRRVFEISQDVKVDGDVYARMAGYLIDKGLVEDIRETIFRGLKDNPRNPNLHYQLARYFNSIGDTIEGEKALRKAIFYFSYGGSLTREELASLVDAKRLLGELYLHQERYLAAEDNYQDAVSLYEGLQERNLIEEDKKYGQIYAGYGDIFYYGGNSLDTAYNLYEKAEENSFNSRELSYKKGFIKYSLDETEKALDEFHKAEDKRNIEIPVLLSKANTLAIRGSYSSALTYYDKLLSHLIALEEESDILYPRENDSHLAIVENYIRIYNNKAVTLYNLYGEKVLPEVGLNFTQSTENYDYLTRDPDLLIRSDSKDLAYYNSRALLFPDKEMDLLLYKNISKDFDDMNLGVVKRIHYGSGEEQD